MKEFKQEGLLASQGLDPEHMQQIMELEELCGRHDPNDFTVKLEISMMRNRPIDQINDFLYFQDGKLIGYLGMYAIIKPNEVEITGMVHPEYRQKGIFKTLFAEAKKECSQRNVSQLLLVCNKRSESAKGFALSSGATYLFSEYKLDYSASASSVQLTEPELALDFRPAGWDDFDDLVTIGMSGFGDPAEFIHALVTRNLTEVERQSYIGLIGEQPVGMITASRDGDVTFVTSFCVMQGNQGKGIGRWMLSQILGKLKQASTEQISIEVETDNMNALSLYQSIGFVIDAGFDYYFV